MKLLPVVFAACIVALVAGQASAKPRLPTTQKAATAHTAGRSPLMNTKHRMQALKYASKKSAASRLGNPLPKSAALAAAVVYPGPTVNAQEIRDRAQEAVARAKSAPTTWKAWEDQVKAKMAAKKLASVNGAAAKVESVQHHPQKAYVYTHRDQGAYHRQVMASEEKKIPKTIPHQQKTVAKQQMFSNSQPKTVPYPGAVKQATKQEARSFDPGMPQWNSKDLKTSMYPTQEKVKEVEKMVKERAQQSVDMDEPDPAPPKQGSYGYPPRPGYPGRGYPGRGGYPG